MMSPFMQWNNFGISYNFPEKINEIYKPYFCNFIYFNGNAHYMRDKLFNDISKYKFVHSIGQHLKNTDNIKYGEYILNSNYDTVSLKLPFKFSIASENAAFNGYTSEKVFTSIFARTIPIYFGNPEIELEINKDLIINANIMNDNELLECIEYYDHNNAWLDKIN